MHLRSGVGLAMLACFLPRMAGCLLRELSFKYILNMSRCSLRAQQNGRPMSGAVV